MEVQQWRLTATIPVLEKPEAGARRTGIHCAIVCMCVCVCVRERETERYTDRQGT